MAILIVEPNSMLRDSLVSLLEADGYSKVLAAGTAEECLSQLETHAEDPEALPDCVILSSQLPDISGLECVRLIHSKPLWRDLPVIMLLEQAIGSAIDSALEPGASDFIAQPISGPVLLARVRQSLALKAETDRRKERERELLQVTARLQDVISSLQGLASVDALTGLANKRSFDESLAREWRRMLRDHAPLSLIMGDLDEFSRLNSSLGRVKGDDSMRGRGPLPSRSMSAGRPTWSAAWTAPALPCCCPTSMPAGLPSWRSACAMAWPSWSCPTRMPPRSCSPSALASAASSPSPSCARASCSRPRRKRFLRPNARAGTACEVNALSE